MLDCPKGTIYIAENMSFDSDAKNITQKIRNLLFMRLRIPVYILSV